MHEVKRSIRISQGGQISVPADVRRRWGTSTLLLEDQGDRIVLRPASEDAISAAEGSLAGEFRAVDVARLRREARASETAAGSRRAR
jgi:bifunctional DNA-binding transcriptional regulator/antitoxin component of YhaV-PrlF toxin-antitoxin module